METAPELEPDQVQLLASGYTRFRISGTVYTLRPPRFGEFKALYLAMNELTETQPKTLDDLADQMSGLVGWVRLVFEGGDYEDAELRGLADRELPPEGEWPAWMTGPSLPGTLINHWRDVPLAPGG